VFPDWWNQSKDQKKEHARQKRPASDLQELIERMDDHRDIRGMVP